MKTVPLQFLRRSFLAAAAVATIAACSTDDDAPALVPPDLGSCQKIQVPDSLKLVAHLYGTGVQIYRWNGTSWDFISPSAVLTDDAAAKHTVGIHYSGPTWEDLGGSKVVGTKIDQCTPDAGAIPWLVLSGLSNGQAGTFHGVTAIQRVNTTGGLAPSAGTNAGEVASVAYSTEYYFYAPR